MTIFPYNTVKTYTIFSIVTWGMFFIIIGGTETFAQLNGNPQLLKPGKFTFEFVDIQETANVVPPVTEDEGIVRIILDPSVLRYYSANDVLNWIRNDQFQIRNIKFDRQNVVLRPDGSISFRFEFLFMPNTSRIDRHIQIRNVRDFDIYYQLHELHQQKIINYRLKVAEAPVYDNPRTGKVIFRSNLPEYAIEFVDPTNAVRRFTVAEKIQELDMLPGIYRPIRLSKSGHLDVEATQVVEADSIHTIDVQFRAINVNNISGLRPQKKRRWLVWTLTGIATTSAAAYYFTSQTQTRLPLPPGPPGN
jgi:hypothetical protein